MSSFSFKRDDDLSTPPSASLEKVAAILTGVLPALAFLFMIPLLHAGAAFTIFLLVSALWGALVAAWLYRRTRAYRLGFERAVASGISSEEIVSAVWVRLVDSKEERVGVFTRDQLLLVPRSELKPVERLPLSTAADLETGRSWITWTMVGRRMKTGKGTKDNAAAREVESLLKPELA